MSSPAAASESPRQGEFPFCYADPTLRADTPAVAHWRNRSRYLTRGGFWRLGTALYQYNRGVLGNLVLLSIPIIAIAIAVSYFYTLMRHYPYAVSLGLLIFLLINHLLDFFAYEDRAPPKTRGWQEWRNGFRAFSLGCLVFFAVIESIPPCIEALRYVRPGGTMGLKQTIGFLATAASASGAIRFLSPHSSTGRLSIRLAIGILSWLMVGIILIGVVDYLYFGIPPYGLFLLVPFIALAVAIASLCRLAINLLVAIIVVAIGYATSRKSASWGEFFKNLKCTYSDSVERWQSRLPDNRKWPAPILSFASVVLDGPKELYRKGIDSWNRCTWTPGKKIPTLFLWPATVLSIVLGLIAFCITAPWIDEYSLESRFSALRVAEITRPLTRLDQAIAADRAKRVEGSSHGVAAPGLMTPGGGNQREATAASLRSNQERILAKESEALLTSLSSQRGALELEYNDTWERDYGATTLSGCLPWLESHVATWWLRPGPNRDIYRSQARSGVISEWGVLYPLRPTYHRHAVAFLKSCAEMDALAPLDKQALKKVVTRNSIERLAGNLAPSSALDGSVVQEERRKAAFRAILVHALVKRFLPKGADGVPRLDARDFEPVLTASGTVDAAEADDVVESICSNVFVLEAVGATAVPNGDDEVYAKLLHARALPASAGGMYSLVTKRLANEESTPNAQASRLSLRSQLQPVIDQCGGDLDMQYSVVIEALLACLGQLHDSNDSDGVARVISTLTALPSNRCNDELFNLGGERLVEWRALLRMAPADLAMVAAGMARRDNASTSNAGSTTDSAKYDPTAYLPDSFRQSVSIALDHPSDIPTPFDRPTYVNDSSGALAAKKRRAQLILCHRSVFTSDLLRHVRHNSHAALGELYVPGIPTSHQLRENLLENERIMDTIFTNKVRTPGAYLLPETTLRLLFTRLVNEAETRDACGSAIRWIGVGRYGNLEHLGTMVEEVNSRTWWVKSELVLLVGVALLLFGVAFISPNMTSIHRFYRESLSSAFLISGHKGTVVLEDVDVRLSSLACRAQGSTAPYPLINAVLNVNSEGREAIRERHALPFLFSPLYVGGASGGSESRGYVETRDFEARNPSFTAASAMTISGAAAAPMMGRYTNWAFRLPMVLTNLRLGYWIRDPVATAQRGTFDLKHVRRKEQASIKARRCLALGPASVGCDDIVGLAFSGGGIRSAALNFGIAQGLFRHGVWKYFDYLSTVSGGGYVGTSISVFMRHKLVVSAGLGAASSPTHLDDAAACPDRWAVQCPMSTCLLWEILGYVPQGIAWAYVSDGGHFENLGVYALLERQCSLIIAGDGEADPRGVLDGLSRLSMLAEIDLGVRISFEAGDLEKIVKGGPNNAQHFAVAHIDYGDGKEGWLLYLRSSLTGDEDQTITGYKAGHDTFPHESTTDQFFTEEQFEAYRRLGEHIVNDALDRIIADRRFSTHEDLVALVAGFRHV